MNILIEKKEFSDAVYKVARFADKRTTTLQALSSVLIIAEKDLIKLRATNLETGIDIKISGKCINDGVVAIPAAILQQVAGSITQEGNISLEHTGDTVTIISGSGKSIIKTVPYEDFPSIPFPENPKNKVVIQGMAIKSLFTTISQCASQSSVRPELANIYISIEGGILTAAATDSFRLVEKKIPLSNKGTQGKFLIPAKNAIDIAHALPDDEITMSFDDNQCAFVDVNGMLVSRLTNATYPDYKQIIPKESITEVIVLRKDFENALKRTSIFSDSFQKVRISFSPKKNTIILFAKNTEVGESSESLSASISGSDLDLSFNHRYLSTALSLTVAESISLTAAGIGRPLIIRGVSDASLMYLVSPMNQ